MQSICLILEGIFENLEVLFIFSPLLWIEMECSRCELEFTACFDDIVSLVFVDNHSINAISILVVHVEGLQGSWHDHIGEPFHLFIL